jgi:hypothetical protein
MGRTQPEKRYILDTALEHLPKVTGSEQDMHVHVVQKYGYDGSCSHNEFGEWIPGELHHTQSEYLLIIEASLRDRKFNETLRELNKWLNRLAKRVGIEDILVRLNAYDRELIISNPKPYQEMAEWPSWTNESDGEPAWCEYLMWDRAKDSNYPMKLTYKYYNDPENDAEVERRMAYDKLD